MQVVVWKRIDFRESSRLVTLISRERGRFVALAKGAHRPTSAHLGRLDFLNRCEVQIAGRGIPLLGRTRLLHEPRALRAPERFLTASHVCELLDRALVPDRADPELFDLLLGTITLVERCPVPGLPIVVLGFELRLLRALGLLGDLGSCTSCGRADGRFAAAAEAGLTCSAHRPTDARPVSRQAADWLRRLETTPGRAWPTLAASEGLGESLALSGWWIEHALEVPARHRRLALSRCGG